MATKKKMLQAAAGQAGAGGAALDITDVFSTYLYEGTGAGQTIQNGVNLGQQAKSGEFTDRNAAYPVHLNSAISLSGDFTVEAWVYNDPPNATSRVVFGSDFNAGATNYQFAITSTSHLVTYSNNTFVTATSQPLSTQQWYHIAASRSGSTIYLWVDGQAAGSGTDSNTFIFQNIGALGGYTSDASWVGNISNLRVSNTARYTSSFTPATEALSSDANTILLALQDPPFVDQTNTYSVSNDSSVNASTLSPFGDAAEAGEGGLVWLKARNDTYVHKLMDTDRGPNSQLESNSASGAGNQTTLLTDFNSDGFSLGSNAQTNASNINYASWTFRKAPKFFTCVTWTGDGTSNRAIPHNLGGAVGSYFVKCTSDAFDWIVWHKDLGANNFNLVLNTTAAVTNFNLFSTTAPDSSNVYLGTANLDYFNATGRTYVAYVFAHNDGDGEFGPDGDQDIIKCGSYTGNGSTDGPEIDLGFEPQWVMIKESSAAGNWWLLDNMRGIASGSADIRLKANTSDAEDTTGDVISLTPTGFKVTTSSSSTNTSGETYIYMAIRRGPLAQPESATEVFAQGFAPSSGEYIVNAGFPVDAVIYTATGGLDNYNFDRMRGNPFLLTNTTAAESASIGAFDSNTSFRLAGFAQDSSTYINWMWKRAPGFFDVVAYTGNGTAGRTVPHNLGVAPEMVFVKCRDLVKDWMVTAPTLPSGKFLRLNGTNPILNYGANWRVDGTSTELTLGSEDQVNGAGNTYIAYLFGTVPGVSKVGSFTKSATSIDIDCGFTTGARFILFKKTSSTGDWWVHDTARGINASAIDPYLKINTADAEGTNLSLVEPLASGFTITSALSTGDYIFYAIA